METSKPMIFAPASSERLATAVARCLGVTLSPLEQRDFEDGEYKLRPLVSVRGRDVYLLHSLAADAELSPDDQLCRLLFTAGALRDLGTARLTAVLPYLCYGRKDRRTKTRDPITTRYIAQLIEAVGVDRVVALDVHNRAAYENAFRCRCEHIGARRLFVRWLVDALGERRCTLVSPDVGGVKRVVRFQQALEAELGEPVPTAFMEKTRSSGVVSGERMIGEVAGRVAVIVDDMISSGTTMIRAAHACRQQGAQTVFALATHGLFAGGADTVLADHAIERIVVTDSVPDWRLSSPQVREKVTWLPIAPLLAETIGRLHAEESISDLMD